MVKKRLALLLLLASILYFGDVPGQVTTSGSGATCTPVSAFDYNEGVPTVSVGRLLKEPHCFDSWFIRVNADVRPAT